MMNIAILSLSLCAFALAADQVCKLSSGDRKNGEQWTDDGFVFECQAKEDGSWKFPIVACVTDQGTNIPIGSEKVEKRQDYDFLCKCKKSGQRVQRECSVAQNSSCVVQGVKYAFKKTFKMGDLEYICQGSKGVKISGCYDTKGNKHKEGEEYLLNERFMFKCGGSLTSCILPETKGKLAVNQTMEKDGYVYSCFIKDSQYGLKVDKKKD